MALDIYLLSLSQSEYDLVSNKIDGNSRVKTPLMSWDIYSQSYESKLEEARKEQDIIKVKSYAKKFNWKNNIESIFKNELFEAILITDVKQNIIWVNKGFSKMTGYSKSEALHKSPRFLQGSVTSVKVKQKIKENLNLNLPFKAVITNYKKNGTTYNCEVKIFPLLTGNIKTHYIALERQIN